MKLQFNILKYINPSVFFASLFFGFIAVYFTVPDSRILYVYPTPDNIDAILYRDKTGACFSMKQTEVSCPTNEKDISTVKPQ
jgi:hypothetical protein